jgi:hypothetical protein
MHYRVGNQVLQRNRQRTGINGQMMITVANVQRRLQAMVQYPGCQFGQGIGDHLGQVDLEQWHAAPA